MSQYVIEGTWEEIKLHEAELVGRHLRVTVAAEGSTTSLPKGATKKAVIGTRLPNISVMGKYAGILSSEDFIRQKQEEKELEERPRM